MPRSFRYIIAKCLLLPIAIAAAYADSPRLQIRGRVELPGGAPAAGARLLTVHNNLNLARHALAADADGQFVLDDPFLEQTMIIARSSDEKLQRVTSIAPAQVRTIADKPLRIELRPAGQINLRVTRNGQPAHGVKVAVDNTAASAATNEQGEVHLLIPVGSYGNRISAWHPEWGIGGATLKPPSPDTADSKIEIALQEPQPRRIRVVDQDDRPVAGLLICPNMKGTDSDWFLGRSFDKLSATTGAAGEVVFPWAPKNLQYVNCDGTWSQWVVEDLVHATVEQPSPLLRVRPKRNISGRLIVPAGCEPAGLLIVGQAFGPAHHGDFVTARASADGRFSLAIAPEFAYAIAVCDRDWTSESLTGVLARQGDANEPAPLELRVEPATPLTIQATIGPDRKPLQDTYVSVGREIDSQWIDGKGVKRNGRHDLSDWIWTDEAGTVHCGLGRGKARIVVTHDNWREEKTVDVPSTAPITLAFHKPDARSIRGHLVQAGRAGDFTGVKMVAVEHQQGRSKTTEIATAANGHFEFSSECKQVDFLALDFAGSVCGTATAAETVSDVTLELQPTATYEGEVLSRNGTPVPTLKLTIPLQGAPDTFTRTTTTSGEGKFHFDRVMTGVPLRLSAAAAGRQIILSECYFEPAEIRRGSRLHIYLPSDLDDLPPKPLAEEWPTTLRDARLAKMHMLVAIHDDDPEAEKFVQRHVLDYEEVRAVLDYLPLSVAAGRLRASAADRAFVQKAGLTLPNGKQVVLAAIDGAGNLLASTTIAIDAPTAAADARKFVEAHRPPAIDGNELWRSALNEAKLSGRRGLVQIGGPRCGPCFRLSRWTEDHHEQLDRDYVIVKLQPGRQAGAFEIYTRLRGYGGSIPWTAIVAADEKVLATSDGPLGNIGFPSSVEGVRHFQQMLEKTAHRLSPDDIEKLVATLRD